MDGMSGSDMKGSSVKVAFIPRTENKLFGTGVVESTINAIKECNPLAIGSAYRRQIKEILEDSGWSGKVNLEHDSKRYIDGIFNDVGLVVQLGNKGAATSYFLNLEYMFVMGKIRAAIFVTQTKDHAINRYEMSHPGSYSDGNYCTMDRIVSDLELFSSFLTCPLCIIAVDG